MEGAAVGVARALGPRSEAPTVAEAVAAFLSTLDHPETAGTRRVYASTLRQLRERLGSAVLPADFPARPAVIHRGISRTGMWDNDPVRIRNTNGDHVAI